MIRLTTRTSPRPRVSAGRSGYHGPRMTDPSRRARGFTLVELLVVIIVLGILIALLLPAISGALRSARQASVSAEINAMAQALARFKSDFGDYPPSRVLLMENGNYSSFIGNTTPVPSQANPNNVVGWSPSGGTGDITVTQLATRTLQAFRKFWPKVQLSTNGYPPPNITNGGGKYWYDFNGNGTLDTGAYVLQGHECLVFFLGGIPLPNPVTYSDPGSVTFGMTGFGRDPQNPFSNSVTTSPMYSANRQPPYYEFNPGRLFLDPSNPTTPGIPGYYDTLNNGPPGSTATGEGPINFFAYFSAYGNGNYDPNDVNFNEVDASLMGPIQLSYWVNFPTNGGTAGAGYGSTYLANSPAPNPYSSSATVATSTGTVTYQTPQTFQIISSGVDGLYGLGGQYVPPTQGAGTVPLPVYAPASSVNTTDVNIRRREADNLTNFKANTLQ